MDLPQYLRVLRQYWRSAVVVALVSVALAAGVTFMRTPTFEASSMVFLSVESGGNAGELSQGATYAERQVQAFVVVATTEQVLQPVIDELALDTTPARLAPRISVSSLDNAPIIVVSARAQSGEAAAELSDAVSRSLVTAVDELSPPGPEGSRLVNASIINRAVAPETPASPRPLPNLALGVILGVLVGAGQAIFRGAVDTRIRTVEDLQQQTDVPVLAAIGRVTEDASRPDGAGENRQPANAEAYRRLRTNVGFVSINGRQRSIVVTSSSAAEGKTETVINLARVLADAGESVLLVDADLRRPQVATRMGLDSQLGLSDVLTERGSFEDLAISVTPGPLTVLPAGTIPPNPSELLGSSSLRDLMAKVEKQYDYVLFDSPPLLPVTDAAVLSAQAGGAIVVVRSGKARRGQLKPALELLKTGDVTILGLVLNGVASLPQDGYDSYHATSPQN